MNEELWTRVEAALDARRDPFDDPELAAALAADPQVGPAVERLVERLERLAPTVPSGEVARPRTLAAAAALLAVGAGLFGLRALTPAEPPPPPRFNGPPASVAWTASLVEERTYASPARMTDSTRSPRRVFEWTVTGDVR